MQLVSSIGQVYSFGNIEIIDVNGKPKSIGTGGPPSGPAGGDLSGTYPNPGVVWTNGSATYALLFYPLSSNPAGYIDITALAPYLTSATAAATYVPIAGGSMTGYLTLNADPTSALHAATKQYVDNLSGGINFHAPCHVATTGNLSATYLNGVSGVGATLTSTINVALVIDTHTLSVGDRVLVWQQTAGLENGIYSVTDAGSVSTPWILTRATDADNSPSGELLNGDFTFIQVGATYGGYGFILNTTGAITVGVTAINYVQFNAAQVVAAGFGLQELTPNVLSVDTSLIATVASLASYLTTAAAALTYYPLTNPAGYISGITSLDVTTALGYTPYNATNPAGYITGITSGDVTTALGFTPYNATNPAGYITSAALAPYLTTAAAISTYVPLARNITINGVTQDLSTDRTWTVSATVSDGDKGDITVSGGGTVWNIDPAVVGITELSATGTPSATTFLRGDNTWATPTATDPAGWTTIVKSANQDVTNNATMQDDTDLQFSVVAAGNYMIELLISTSGNSSAGDYKFGFAVSAGTMIGAGSAICQNAALAASNTRIAATAGAVTNAIPVGQNGGTIPTSSGVVCASANYSFTASANATFKFQFANNTAGASITSRTWKGSILRYKRLD